MIQNKQRNQEIVQKNKDKSISKLNDYLQTLIVSNNSDNLKKADLLSYWLKDYTNYIKSENTFIPFKNENYTRGNIIKANLGFNIGSEEGGLHYAIVVNNPDKSSGIVTIVPLTSKKDNTPLHKSEVSLGFSIMDNIIDKLNSMPDTLNAIYKSMQSIEDQNIINNKINQLNKTVYELNKYSDQAKKMKKCESIALVGNIITISKQRIYTPTIYNKFLKGISISNEQLDLIDKKIIELYTKPK